MAKAVSSLNILFGATTAPLAAGAGKVLGIMDSINSKAATVGASLLKWTGVGAAIGAIGGAAGIGALINAQSDAIDMNAKLSDRLGVSTEALTGLQYAADLSGVSTEALTGGLEKYLKNVAGAASGNKQLAAAFQAVGLDAAKLVNMPTDEAIGEIGDGLNAIVNPAQRAAAAQAIFGKSGQALLPFLAEGSDGLAAMMKENDALGQSFSRVDASKVEAANDALSKSGKVFTGLGRQAAIAVAPFVTQFADAFTGVGIKVISAFESVLPAVTGFLQRVIDTAVPMIVAAGSAIWSAIVGTWEAIWGVIGPIVTAIVTYVSDNWQRILTTVVTYGVSLWTAASGAFNAILTVITTIGGAIGDAWNATMSALGLSTSSTGDKVNGSVRGIGDTLLWLYDSASTVFTGIGWAMTNWKGIVELAGTQVMLGVVRIGAAFDHVFRDVIPPLLDWLNNNWFNIFQTMANFGESVFKNLGTNAANFFSALWSAIKGDGFNFEWTGLTDGFKSTLTQLPQIADQQVGPLEQALSDQVKGMQDTLGDGLAAALEKNKATVKAITDGIVNVAKKFAGPKATDESIFFEGDDKPAIPVTADTTDFDKQITASKAKAGDMKNIVSGSAEQMQRIALASLNPRATGNVSDSNGKKIDGTNARLDTLIGVTEDQHDVEYVEAL